MKISAFSRSQNKQSKRQEIDFSPGPDELTKRIIDVLNRGVDFYFVVNPTTAIRWAVNENQYAIATALLKHEERVKMRMTREAIEWLKLLVPIGAFFLILCVGLYILVTGIQSGKVVGGVGI